jgi:nuclear pore complex protein Nup54
MSGLPPQPAADLSAIKELEALRDAFLAQQGNQRCLFQHLFLNVVDDAAARIKPPGVNELKWREAVQRAGGTNNVNHLHPVLALGFKDLLLRKSVQV